MNFLTGISQTLLHRTNFSQAPLKRYEYKNYKAESILPELHAVGIDLQFS